MHTHTKNASAGFSHHIILPVLALLLVGALGVATMNLSSAASKTFTLASCKTKTLRKGSSGSCVKVLQKIINKTRSNDIATDGLFGSGTKSAVITFQKSSKYGGAIGADGVVGPKTWSKLSKVSGASGVAVTSSVKNTSSTSTKKTASCKYKRVIFTGINGPKPHNPKCSSSSVAERQYKADLKAYNIMYYASRYIAADSDGSLHPDRAQSYIVKKCKASTIKLVYATSQWDVLSTGSYLCVSKVLK